MPKVKQVVAAKSYPQYKIEKGQKHYHWVLKTGPRSSRTFRQMTPPRPSQLTTSEFLGTIGDIVVEFDEIVRDDSAADTLRDIAERVGQAGEEQQERFDNLPENFQMGDTGQMMEERVSQCESWKDEIEQAADELDNKIEEINGKAWHELDEFSHLDPEDEGFDEADTPSDEDIEEARERERADAYDEAITAASDANPGF